MIQIEFEFNIYEISCLLLKFLIFKLLGIKEYD